jgi:hypothetical protein
VATGFRPTRQPPVGDSSAAATADRTAPFPPKWNARWRLTGTPVWVNSSEQTPRSPSVDDLVARLPGEWTELRAALARAIGSAAASLSTGRVPMRC